ncbi:MAG: SpoIIE family protein phosphatase [Rhodothermales bacterium]
MEATRWDELETLFEQALALPADQRPAFLNTACADDSNLRAELESLLAYADLAPSFFDHLRAVVPVPANEEPSTPPADDVSYTTTGPYQVLEKIGGGGMGVVYRALDTRLDRIVALKFLPPHLSASEQAKKRFTAEARAASALDHVNICTIFDIGETDRQQLYIAMACYDGETLKQKIARGALSLDVALDCALQIAQGLTKAHTQGITHRDVKPANIILTEDGVVKILDFGLAKMADVQLTKTGTTMGTAAYMSPEQAQGAPVDHRTDFWSLGVVFYEMLTGQRPFTADYEQAVLYSVLHVDHKPVAQLRPELPAELDHFLHKTLAKDPDERYQHGDDLLVDLKRIQKNVAEQSLAEQAVRQETPSLDEILSTPRQPFSGQPASSASSSGGSVIILVVDDEPELELLIRFKFRKKIRANDWSFIFAQDGVEALELLQADPDIALVLTDLNMPRMDGLTLLTRLGETNRLLKAVVISAYGDMDNIRTAMNRGAFDFVTKPIDFEDLETTILKTEQEWRALRQATEAQHQLVSLRKELDVARELQEAILPHALPPRDDVELYAFMAPAREVNGDFYDFFLLDEDRLGFVVGEVSSKGVSAALFTVMSRTLIRAIAMQGGPPGASVQHMQELLFLDALPEISVSVFYGILDSRTGDVTYCNAGQPTPYVLHADGTVAPPINTEADDMAIRLLEDAEYQTGALVLQPGDGLFLCTNGLLRAPGDANRLTSNDWVSTLLRQLHASSPAEIIRAVIREVARLSGEAPPEDDLTALALRYRGR